MPSVSSTDVCCLPRHSCCERGYNSTRTANRKDRTVLQRWHRLSRLSRRTILLHLRFASDSGRVSRKLTILPTLKPETTLREYAKFPAHERGGQSRRCRTPSRSPIVPEENRNHGSNGHRRNHQSAKLLAHDLPTDCRGIMRSDAVAWGWTACKWQGSIESENPWNFSVKRPTCGYLRVD